MREMILGQEEFDLGNGWIAVDFDGTLAQYDGTLKLGKPIPAMCERVKNWVAEGYEVRIFTARVASTSVGRADLGKLGKKADTTLIRL